MKSILIFLPQRHRDTEKGILPFSVPLRLFGKKYSHILYLLVLTFTSLWGQDASEMRLAESYFDAKDFEQAAAEYRSEYDEELPSWQQAILYYDIGTSLLAQGKYEDALSNFHSASLLNANLPLLDQRLATNLTLALLMSAKAHSQKISDNPNATADDYSQTLALYRQALAEVETADAASCALDRAAGAKQCTQSIVTKEMRLETKADFADLLKRYLVFNLSHGSLQEGAAALIAAANTGSRHLEILQSPNFDQSLRDKYTAFYFDQANSWTPLWDAMDKLINQGTDLAHYEKYAKLFNLAKSDYFESLDKMKEQSFADSADNLNESRIQLEKILTIAVAAEPLEAALQRLLIAYKLMLVKEPIQETPLLAVAEAQEALGDIIKPLSNTLKANYVRARHYLSLSLASLQQYQLTKARVFAEAARFFINSIADAVIPSPKNQAAAILENSIKKEELALLMNRLMLQPETYGSGFNDAQGIPSEVQRTVLNVADGFLTAALEQQKKAFNAPGGNRCQCSPWDEVIPLFNAGYTQARSANDIVQKVPISASLISAAVPLQDSALRNWKEALEKLRAKPKTKTPAAPKSAEQKPPEKSKEQLNDVLRLIQQMEIDDHSRPAIKVSGQTGEDRPW